MIRYVLLLCSLFVLDRVTKWLAISFLAMNVSQEVYSCCGMDFFFTLTMNKGAAWGILQDFPFLLLIGRVVLIGLMSVFFFHSQQAILKTAIVMIVAGAFSNIIDTIFFGHVIDMIHVRLIGWDYPVFNVADISITLGSILFLVGSIVNTKKRG